MYPVSKKYISKCLKSLKKNLDVYLDILCSHPKFRKEITFFMGCVKKDNFR